MTSLQAERIHEPNFVLLHGFGTSSRVWRHVAEDLAGARPLHPDLPGFGSCADQSGYSVREMADAVQGDIEKAGLARFVLVGHSMGGKVALDLAARRPEGLAGLVLIAPSPPTPEPMTDEDREKLKAAYGNQEALRALYERITRRELEPLDWENLIQDGLRASQAAWDAWPDSGSREDISGEVGGIDVPTLVIASRDDPVMALGMIEREVVDRLKGAQLDVLSGVGHLLPLEAPRDVTRHLLHWARTALREEITGGEITGGEAAG